MAMTFGAGLSAAELQVAQACLALVELAGEGEAVHMPALSAKLGRQPDTTEVLLWHMLNTMVESDQQTIAPPPGLSLEEDVASEKAESDHDDSTVPSEKDIDSDSEPDCSESDDLTTQDLPAGIAALQGAWVDESNTNGCVFNVEGYTCSRCVSTKNGLRSTEFTLTITEDGRISRGERATVLFCPQEFASTGEVWWRTATGRAFGWVRPSTMQ